MRGLLHYVGDGRDGKCIKASLQGKEINLGEIYWSVLYKKVLHSGNEGKNRK